MTLPLTQPTIIRARERPNPFTAFLDAFQAGMQMSLRKRELDQRAAEHRDQLALDQQRLLLEASRTGVLNKETQARIKQIEQELKTSQEAEADRAEAAPIIQTLTESGALLDPKAVAEATKDLKRPGAVRFFHDTLGEVAQGRQAAARAGALERLPGILERQTPQAAQALETMTTLGLTGAPSTPSELARLGVAGFEGLQAPPPGVDPSLWAQGIRLWESGIPTWSEAMRSVGLPTLPGVDPNAKAPPRQQAQRMQALAAKAAANALTMRATDSQIDALVTSTGGPTLAGEVLKSIRGKNLFLQGVRLGFNFLASPEQQQLAQASSLFTQAWRQYITGAQASEPEFVEFVTSLTPGLGDSPAAVQQKAIMRKVLIQTVERAASGTDTRMASDVVTELLEMARSQRYDPSIVRYLERQLLDAKSWEATHPGETPTERIGGAPSDEPTTDANLSDAISRTNSFIDSLVPVRR